MKTEPQEPAKPEASPPVSTQPKNGADVAAAFAAAAEAALVELETRFPLGMGPVERALGARLRAAIGSLLECAVELEYDELMVLGSTGQRRAHPLLKIEQDLRREISDGLEKLLFRVEQRASFERLTALHRRKREAGTDDAPAGEPSP